MPVPALRLTPPSWLRLPRRTARLRLTLLYGGLFLVCGVVLLTITYLLSEQAIDKHAIRAPASSSVPVLHGVPVHPVEPAPGSQAQALLAGVNRELAARQASELHHLLVNSGIALAIVALLAILLGYYVAGRVLRPVRTITATARRISASNLDQRLALDDADDEFKELGGTLNDLLARLQTAFDAQQHFVANASHELRTPLTAERTILQVALDDPDTTNETWRSTAREALASNDEQEHLIEALLALASSETGVDHHEPIDLSVLTDAALLGARPQTEARRIEVTPATATAPTTGDPALVERLIANLIDNAVRHNTPGGRVHVQTTTTADGHAQLIVTNTGPEIPAPEIQRLFEPFQRLKTTRTNGQGGYGLGLSIVQAITTAHDATLSARPQPGGGLHIEVRFPPASAPNGNGSLPAQRPDTSPSSVLAAQNNP
jgi:signal transduction histidine kinase